MLLAGSNCTRKRVPEWSGFAEKWAIVEDTVRCIFGRASAVNSFQRIHHSVFQLCQAQCGSMMLEHLEEQFKLQVEVILQRVNASPFFASSFLQEWQSYNDAVSQISNILLYFDKNYMYAYHHSSIEQAAERIFCANTLGVEEVAARLTESIKESVEVAAAYNVVRDLGQELFTAESGKYFVQCMEDPFVDAKVQKYDALAEAQKTTLNPSEYLQWVQSVISEERKRYADTFFYIVLDKLTNALYAALVHSDPTYVQQTLLGPAGLEKEAAEWNIAHIDVFIQVFCAMRREKDVIDVIVRVIKESGDEILLSRDDNAFPFAAVDKLLSLITKAKTLDTLFPAEEGFTQAPFLRVVRNVLGSHSRFMETLSLYYDAAIRQYNDEIIETVSNNVLDILQLTPDLEPFESAFRSHLAARLIHAKPDAVDIECFFIDRLFNIYGTSVVNRFQKMVEDIRNATAAQQKLVTEMAARKNTLPIELDVLVLTSGLWPQYANLSLNAPASMEACKYIFGEYYRRRHNGRKLVFQMSLGSVLITLGFRGSLYVISAHTHFVNTILAMNSCSPVSVAAVAQSSGLGQDEVQSQVNILCNLRVACRANNETYQFNGFFYSPKKKLKVSTAVQKSSTDGTISAAATRKNAEGMRTMSLDATIVKLLKQHQSMEHEKLCEAIQLELSDIFSPTKGEIKHRIEALIEKGYLVRGESSNRYFYCT